jgi:hypothetical protein
MDSEGKTQPLHLSPGYYLTPRFSPDGKHLAFATRPNPVGSADIRSWISRAIPSRFSRPCRPRTIILCGLATARISFLNRVVVEFQGCT